MWRYVKAAFWLRSELPALGQVPLNVLLVAGVAILGAVFPALWFLGLGLETAYLFLLSTHPRFQTLVDGQGLVAAQLGARQRKHQLVGQLSTESQRRMVQLEDKVERILKSYHGDDSSQGALVDTYREMLSRPLSMSLQLLLFREKLQVLQPPAAGTELQRQLAAVRQDLEQPSLTPAARQSKEATLAALSKRLDNLSRRDQLLQEVDSDLFRIESELDLALEKAVLQRAPQLSTGDLDVAVQLLDELGDLFGYRIEDDAELARAFQVPSALATKQ